MEENVDNNKDKIAAVKENCKDMEHAKNFLETLKEHKDKYETLSKEEKMEKCIKYRHRGIMIYHKTTFYQCQIHMQFSSKHHAKMLRK